MGNSDHRFRRVGYYSKVIHAPIKADATSHQLHSTTKRVPAQVYRRLCLSEFVNRMSGDKFGLAVSPPRIGKSLPLPDTAQIELSPSRAKPCESKAVDATLPGQELVGIQVIPATGLVQR